MPFLKIYTQFVVLWQHFYIYIHGDIMDVFWHLSFIHKGRAEEVKSMSNREKSWAEAKPVRLTLLYRSPRYM